jgi:hypothetical protein
LNADTDADERNDGLEAGEDWENQKYTYEAGEEGWEKVIEPNLWDRTSARSNSPSYSFHCGRDSVDDIDSHLWTPWFRLPLTDDLLLDFQFWWDPIYDEGQEQSGDRAMLSLEVYGSEDWDTLWSHYGSDSIPHNTWTQTDSIDVAQFGGELVRLLLYHNSIAGSPSIEGWYVDDLRIKGTTNPVQKDTDAEAVSDGDETTTSYKLRTYSFEYDSEGWWANDWWWDMAWSGSTNRAHSGTYSMHIGHYHLLEGGDRTAMLASPLFRLPLSKTLTLSFWHRLDGGTETQKCGLNAEVYISVSGRENAYFLGRWDPWESFDWTYVSYTSELSQFSDEIIALKFYYSMVNCQWWDIYEGWYVDDVIVEATSNPLRVDTDEDGLDDYPEITSKYNGEKYNFDEELDNWVAEGLWEIATANSHISYHCGRVTFATSLSDLISPPMRLPMSTYLEVSFWYWWDPIPFDSTGVYIGIVGPELPGFTSWVLVDLLSWGNPAIPKETWTKAMIDISQYAGEVVRFKFFSVTYQGDESVSEGVYIDDLEIRGTNNPVAWDTDEDIVGDYSEIVGFESGYVVNPSGFDYETSPILWDTDLDGSGDGHDPVPIDWDMDGDGIPNDSDSNMDGDIYLNSEDLDDDNDGMSDEYESKYGVAGTEIGGGGWQSPTVHNRRYAILSTGVGDAPPYGNFPAFWNDIKHTRSKLIDYSFDSDDIYVLGGFDTNERDGIPLYGPTTRESTFRAFDEIRLKSTKNDLLFIVFTTHSGPEYQWVLRDDVTWGTSIKYDEISATINGDLLELHYGAYTSFHSRKAPVSNARMVYVMQGCDTGAIAPKLKGEQRIIVMSSRDDEWAWTEIGSSEGHFGFLYEGRHYAPLIPWGEEHPGFSLRMGDSGSPLSIMYAFDKGYVAARNNWDERPIGGEDGRSYPQLEDNGNGLTQQYLDPIDPSDPARDGWLSAKTYL